MIVKGKLKKGRNVILEFDNSEKLTIPYEIYLKNTAELNESISAKEIRRIEEDSEIYNIRESCFRYLSNRNHSRFELKQKLLKKKYNSGMIEAVLNALVSDQIINDEQFAQDFFKSKLKRNIGPVKIKSALFQKGIDREIIDSVAEIESDELKFFDNALSIAEKKYKQLAERNTDSRKIKQKIYAYLISRGYSTDIISNVIKEIKINNE